jgi:hypothetical protein
MGINEPRHQEFVRVEYNRDGLVASFLLFFLEAHDIALRDHVNYLTLW